MNIMAYWNMSYGVYVVTTMDGDRPVGCVANSAMQISAEPPTIAVSINKQNFTHDSIVKNGTFALSIMPENIDPKVIGTFGFMSSRDTDKFAETDYQMIEDLPVIGGTAGHFICKMTKSMDCGTHTVFLGEVVDCDILAKEKPMTYEYYHKVIKGKAPKTAPTYIAPELLDEENTTKMVCSVCSYEYNGDIPFEDLPDDYVCPICGQGKEVFKAK